METNAVDDEDLLELELLWEAIDEEGRGRLLRFAQRVAALPKHIILTPEQAQYMSDNDADFPYS
ncbi:hypothetical protein [Pseudoduganella lutea]|uniref:Uncharacterized protein n=1 Tax=Pseudoduganella lutea TaxID=321985 RepID=A0A4P6L431_9BURK|nr:hypothetical protein [Pseudoduganella lutea]QBE66340.1 hypothetical protein EWM63_27985 [Pseudoduganella lutea]